MVWPNRSSSGALRRCSDGLDLGHPSERIESVAGPVMGMVDEVLRDPSAKMRLQCLLRASEGQVFKGGESLPSFGEHHTDRLSRRSEGLCEVHPRSPGWVSVQRRLTPGGCGLESPVHVTRCTKFWVLYNLGASDNVWH